MLKSIIYLDEPKLFSLSSQLFEGLTEYRFKEIGSSSEKTEEQRGPVGSGRLLADAIREHQTSLEKRIFHDFAFEAFEEKLREEKRILEIGDGASGIEPQLAQYSFIRIHATAKFVDAAQLRALLKMFNKLGEALTYITNHAEIRAASDLLENMKTGIRDKGKLAKIQQQQKALGDAAKLAQEKGLYQDPKFLEYLDMVTQFGYSDQLEVQQKLGELQYSTNLKREFLRESEDLLIRKYSRITEKKLVVLGVITQTAVPAKPLVPADAATDKQSMKEAFTGMVEHIATLETSLAGKSPHEVIVDPIAVYVPL
jgi:hypothetical protein